MNFYAKFSGSHEGYLNKFLLVMRLTVILLIAGILQVSATTYGQRLTLNKKSITVKQVFKEIKNQTGYDVLWQSEKFNADKVIEARFNQAPLQEVINACISGQGVGFEIEDKSIVIKGKEVSRINANPDIKFQDSVTYRGTVYDETGQPLPGASILVKGSKKSTRTLNNGIFSIHGPKQAILVFSYIGYGNQEVQVKAENALKPLRIVLTPASTDLQGVSIVSTGYQDIPKERATGSFEVITAKQLEHSTSPNLLRRLEGITTSMDLRNDTRPTNSSAYNKNNSSILNTLTIRGKNNLENLGSGNFSGSPLVVIDGIASAYNIDQINPDDVESITVLKDAASASIWGSRAANGVLVIKTKRGGFNKPARVSFNSNVTVSDKMDLFYFRTMSISDFIDAQQYRFNREYPLDAYPLGSSPLGNIDLVQAQYPTSPVFEILNSQRNGSIDETMAKAQLDALRENDVRRDYTKYFLQNSVAQQYSLSIDGGSKAMAYRLSGGYNHTMENTKKAGSDRFSLAYNAAFKPVKKLTLNTGITYIQNNRNAQSAFSPVTAAFKEAPIYPYTKLADDFGNSLIVPRDYRPGFLDLLESTYGDKVLNMRWKPLENMNEGYLKDKAHTLNFTANGDYKISEIFSASLIYNYSKTLINSRDLAGANSYYMRNLINRYTNPTTFNRVIPLGGQYLTTNQQSDLHTLRGLLNASKNWNNRHEISAVAGVDVSQNFSKNQLNRYYGYDENSLRINSLLDYKTFHPFLFKAADGASTGTIPSEVFDIIENKVRNYSLFSNIAYTFNQKYSLSASIRKDASSEFGSGTNSGGTPFFSFGTAWDITKEKFFDFPALTYLKLRATYGYNGNVNPRVPANPTIAYGGSNNTTTGFPYARADDFITNRKLRPERTGMFNLGLDFASKGNRISGTVEYYDKKTKDLIKDAMTDPTLGYNRIVFNSGDLQGYGVDVNLNTLNIQARDFSWSSNFLFSYNRVKVTKLFVPANNIAYIATGEGGSNYDEGYDLNRLFAWRWMGLDPQTGNPIVNINGQPIVVTGSEPELSTATVSDLKYMGSAVPVYYGSFRNTFSFKGFSASFNLLYKLGYYARRPINSMVQYSTLFSSFDNIQGEEYGRRWQKPGDELTTNVPSLLYSSGFDGAARDLIYRQSDINIIKADHIRLQEINLSYAFKNTKGFLKNPRVYANVNNLGIIWRANKVNLDPDIQDYPNPRQYSFGFSTNF